MTGSKEMFMDQREAEQNGVMKSVFEFVPSKQAIEVLSNNIIESVRDGSVNTIEAAVKLKFIVDALTVAKTGILSEVRDELNKYTKGEKVTAFGAELTAKETGTKYDYSNCNDSEWNELNQQLNEIKEKMKPREAFLKSLQKKTIITIEETGETFEVFPPLKTSTSSYEIRWKS